jgi:hypothetical protein
LHINLKKEFASSRKTTKTFIRELQGRTELQNAGALKVPIGDLWFRVDCPRLGSHKTTKGIAYYVCRELGIF